MKKLLLSAVLVSAIAFTSCRDEKKAEEVEDTIENAAEETEEAAEDGFEATGKAIDDAVEEATDDDN